MKNQTLFQTVYLGGFALIPFLISPTADDPVLPLRFLGMALWVGVLLVLYGKNIFDPTFLKNVPFMAWLGYVGLSTVSIFYSLNTSESLYEVARLIVNTLFLLISIQFFRQNNTFIRHLALLISLIAILTAGIGLLQFYKIAFLNLCSVAVIPCGCSANRNLFASILVLYIPFMLYFLTQTQHTLWRYAVAIGLLLVSIAIFLAQTRTAYLNYLILFVFTSFYFYSYVAPKNRKYFALALTSVLLFVGALSYQYQSLLLQKFEFSNLLDAKNSSIGERIFMWERTWQMIQEQKWVKGVGLGNWFVHYPKYNVAHSNSETGKLAPTDPHNDYLTIIAETGIFAFFSYVLFLFSLLWFSFKQRQEKLMGLVCIGLFVYSLDALVSFPKDRIEHSLMFILMAAIVLGSKPEQEKAKTNSVGQKYAFVLSLLLMLSVVFFAYQRHQNNKLVAQIRQMHANQNYRAVIALYAQFDRKYLETDLHTNPIELYLADSYLNQKDFENALVVAEKGLISSPYHLGLLNESGAICFFLKKYDQSIAYYQGALAISPTFRHARIWLSKVYLEGKNDPQKAIETLGKAENDQEIEGLIERYRNTLKNTR